MANPIKIFRDCQSTRKSFQKNYTYLEVSLKSSKEWTKYEKSLKFLIDVENFLEQKHEMQPRWMHSMKLNMCCILVSRISYFCYGVLKSHLDIE